MRSIHGVAEVLDPHVGRILPGRLSRRRNLVENNLEHVQVQMREGPDFRTKQRSLDLVSVLVMQRVLVVDAPEQRLSHQVLTDLYQEFLAIDID